MKLLPLALQKQNYYLAAHILVYGLVRATVNQRKGDRPAPLRPDSHGNKTKTRKS